MNATIKLDDEAAALVAKLAALAGARYTPAEIIALAVKKGLAEIAAVPAVHLDLFGQKL